MQLYILRVGFLESCTELTSHNYQLSIQEFIMGGGGGGGGAGGAFRLGGVLCMVHARTAFVRTSD